MTSSVRLVPEWDAYFINLAEAASKKSKDPNAQVGAVIVNDDKLVVSTGFNGMARSIEDDPGILADKEKKLDWMVHAEHNAILNAARNGVRTLGCEVYVNKFPCFTCLLAIVQVGIRRVYTNDDEFWKNDPMDATHVGKRYVIERSGLILVAPNHPEFRAKRLPELAKPLRKTKASVGQLALPSKAGGKS